MRRVAPAPGTGCWPASTSVPGYGWRRVATGRARRRAGGCRRRLGGPSTTGCSPSRSIPADGTFAIDGRSRAGAAGRRRRRRRHLQLLPARRRPVVDRPIGGRRAESSKPGRCGAASGCGRRTRGRSVPTPAPPGRRARGRGAAGLELRAGERLVRVESRSTTGAATTGCGRGSRCPSRPRCRRPSAPSPSSSGASPPRAGPTEVAMPTFPSRRFVQAGGLTVVHEGLLEYELVDIDGDAATGDGRSCVGLALTLLRCTGLLSQGPMATRPLPAGPVVAGRGGPDAGLGDGALRGPRRRGRPVRAGRRRLPAVCWPSRAPAGRIGEGERGQALAIVEGARGVGAAPGARRRVWSSGCSTPRRATTVTSPYGVDPDGWSTSAAAPSNGSTAVSTSARGGSPPRCWISATRPRSGAAFGNPSAGSAASADACAASRISGQPDPLMRLLPPGAAAEQAAVGLLGRPALVAHGDHLGGDRHVDAELVWPARARPGSS